MRAAFFYETKLINGEADFHASGWPSVIAQVAFASQGLEPFALITGMPNLVPENTVVNFSATPGEDLRELTRVLFEIPDIPGDDLLLIFAGNGTKALSEVKDGLYTEKETHYYAVICGVFGAMAHTFQAEAPGTVEFQTATRMSPRGELSDTVAVALLKDCVVKYAEQQYFPSEQLVEYALQNDLPLPPGFDLEKYQAELAEYKASVPVVADAVEPVIH